MKRTKRRMRWAVAHACTCQQCGVPFRSIKKGARYCSTRCRVASHRARAAILAQQADPCTVGQGG